MEFVFLKILLVYKQWKLPILFGNIFFMPNFCLLSSVNKNLGFDDSGKINWLINDSG